MEGDQERDEAVLLMCEFMAVRLLGVVVWVSTRYLGNKLHKCEEYPLQPQ